MCQNCFTASDLMKIKSLTNTSTAEHAFLTCFPIKDNGSTLLFNRELDGFSGEVS